MKGRFIHLQKEDTKEKKAKDIPIGEDVFKMFISVPRGIHGSVFLYRGKPIADRFEKSLKNACNKAGIKWGKVKGGFIFHDLRHTFITDMRIAGVHDHVIRKIVGHSTKRMTERYDKVNDKDKPEAIAQLEAYRRNELAKVDQGVDQTAIQESNLLNFQR
jgi:integrase